MIRMMHNNRNTANGILCPAPCVLCQCTSPLTPLKYIYGLDHYYAELISLGLGLRLITKMGLDTHHPPQTFRPLTGLLGG